ncbi:MULTISPECIES: hypothetical protein [unclassified Exiguobacterium]|uniref:lmo0954 family membrane protein n=1 Tax=unclassified Exiguobacterium TaxID=2644629 RepID=UPI001BEC4653|nr:MULTISPECIES: hypothetical protein [unclassified Exiguobacterium]
MNHQVKKVLFIVAGIALVLVLIGALPNMILFGLGALLTLWAGVRFQAVTHIGAKVGFGILVVVGIGTMLSNIWALVGVIVAWLLFKGYMMYTGQKRDPDVEILDADGTRAGRSSFQQFDQVWQKFVNRR